MSAETGGPPRVVVHLAKAQADRGARVTIASPGIGASQLVLQNLGVDWQPDTHVSFQPHLGAISQSDVVHVHGVWEPLLHTALRTARRLRKVTIVTPHGMLSHYGMGKKPLKKTLSLR